MAHLTNEQFRAITRYRYLGGVRPSGIPHISVATIGRKQFDYVTGWWTKFDLWMDFKDKGGPRPKGIWRIVPLFAWSLRRDILKARPKATPKPPATPTPPVPPLPAWAMQYQNVIFLGQDTYRAVHAPKKYKVAFTADPGYDSWATRAMADAFRDNGREVFVWYVPTQVSAARAEEVAQRVGAAGIIGQAETIDEFWASWNHGRRVVVGNLSAIFEHEDAAKLIREGQMVFVNEFYWNQDSSRKPDNHNLPVSSLCVACYDGHSDSTSGNAWEPHMPQYQAAGYTWPTMSIYGPGATEADYEALP